MPNPEYLRDRDSGDVYKRVHGDTYQRISVGNGGIGCLGIFAIGLVIGLCILVVSSSNFVSYHVFTWSQADAQRGATATAIAPYHIEERAIDADISGDVTVTSILGSDISQNMSLGKGGAVIYKPNVPETGTYYLCIDGDTDGRGGLNSGVIVNVVINNKQYAKFDVTSDNGHNYLGSQSYTSCISNNIVHLNKGINSVKVSLKSTYCYENEPNNCIAFIAEDIILDIKTLT